MRIVRVAAKGIAGRTRKKRTSGFWRNGTEPSQRLHLERMNAAGGTILPNILSARQQPWCRQTTLGKPGIEAG